MSTNNNNQSQIDTLIKIGSNAATLDIAQKRAAQKLLMYDGEIYPHDGCAITLSIMLQDAGIKVPDTYQAITLTNELRDKLNWKVIKVGDQLPGDIGTTCGDKPNHGFDHIYLVLKRLNDDEMLIADNQSTQPHFRWASGNGGRTPTKYFLRSV